MKNNIAVLIPTKNRRTLLEKALQSVLNQTVLPDEIIVINDGSTDETANFLIDFKQKYDYVSVIQRGESGGVNTARNQGIRSITSDWIVFLDDDDELTKDAISIIKEKVSLIPSNYSLLCFNTVIKNDTEEFTGGFQFKDNREFFDPTYEEFMVKYGLRGDCKPVFRREVFVTNMYWFEESVNGFESITIRRMIRDGNAIRYYKQISTIINQMSTIEHLSASAPLKNPEKYLDIHRKDLKDHIDFYKNNKSVLINKYVHMSQISWRAGMYKDCLNYFLSAVRLWFGMSKHYAARLLGHMRFLRLGIRYRIILPIEYTGYNFSTPFFGYVYKGNLNDHIDRQVFYFGAYEYEELSFFKKYIDKESIVLDIGANTGHHSLFFSRYGRQVYSFEPYDKMFHILENRIYDNNIQNIQTFNYGLGDSNQSLDFFAPEGKNKGIGSFVKSEVGKSIGKLEIKKGDDIVSDLNVSRVSFIKIDVEGMEISVLQGLLHTINTHKPVMFIEMSPESQHTIYNEFKSKLGAYKLYIIQANNPVLFFFDKQECLLKDFVPTKTTQNIICIPQ